MRRTLILACALALTGQSLAAQSTLLSGRSDWTDQAPRVRVSIDGARALNPGTPVHVRFEVSDDAFVTVVRVDGDGRMTILFPYARNQRAAARAGIIHQVRNPRLGNASFVANDRFGGYVFALASYAPLDFSGFANRDYERLGGWSSFTQVNRDIAQRPDVFIDRFAAAVLWDRETPYDYDVDYYVPAAHSTITNAYSMCGSLFYDSPMGFGRPLSAYADWDLVAYPYRSMCRSWMAGVRCLSYSLYSVTGCSSTIVANPTTPVGLPTDSTVVPNEGVIRGGMAAPTPAPVIPVGLEPSPPAERPAGAGAPRPRFAEGNDWDKIMSIPARATRRMKEDDAIRERGSLENSFPVRTAPERPEVKREQPRTMDATARSTPPQREPTRVRETREQRNNPETRSAPTRRSDPYAQGGTSAPRPATSGTSDRVNRPIEAKPATTGPASPPATKTTAPPEEKKKPPTDQR